ncbi:tRNA (adenosine(37)-N6)-dimethylallyltransferase MiaA [Candidatus Bipolaricaulota bacterium]|nr:tRNA (adenosine(37)-N6)-dimethylallyltransferase MiaA [Candidatus Bipolaricaulota bacterium]
MSTDEPVAGDREPVLVIFGPTAVGKTAVAMAVARRLDAEIISADSRAFFCGLDVVTDKPTREQRAEIPHHLIDCVPIDGAYDAMAFREDVVRLVPEIRARGRVPLIVGGGTLYLGALLRGLFEGPSSDESLRAEMAERSVEELHQELHRADPAAAEAIHPNDRLRIERALEVYRLSGRPISAWQAEATPLPFRFVVVGLERARDAHREAIAARVRRMVGEGLVEEFERLRAAGLTSACQAYRSIGILEAAAYIAGEITGEEMEARITNRTWQLARRQWAWFRREKGVRWIDVGGRDPDAVADGILAVWNRALEEE